MREWTNSLYLDELNVLVRTLNCRIAGHREILTGNEAATRYALIDPLLSALGWDTSDPAIVEPEYQSGSGRADYVLKGVDGNPSLIVEAKRLGRSVGDGITQSITYCIERGVKYFVVTDGDHWRAYETYKPVPIEQKQLIDFRVSGASQPTVMKMLWLWRGNFASNQPEFAPDPPAPIDGSERATPESVNSSEGVPLSTYKWARGCPKPNSIRFPDGTSKPIRNWRYLQISAVEWLSQTGRISVPDCPVTDREGGAYLVNSKPERRSGKSFVQPKSINGMWIELHFSGAEHVRMAKRILASRGVTADGITLNFPS